MNTDQRHAVQSMETMLPRGLLVHPEHNDIPLVKASQQGDQNAYALLVQRHQQRVFALSVRLLQNPKDANEATQEAFLAAWQRLPSFRGDALFQNWLYRITYTCCLHVLEERTREHLLQEAMHLEQTFVGNDAHQPELSVERHAEQTLVCEYLEHLPDRYRLVLLLRHFQERTYEEMADILVLPIGTIKTHLFRARKLLKARVLAHTRRTQA